MLPRLECSGVIIADCSLKLLGSNEPPTVSLLHSEDYRCMPPHPANFLVLSFVEMGSHYATEANLKLLGLSHSPASSAQSAGIIDVSHLIQPAIISHLTYILAHINFFLSLNI